MQWTFEGLQSALAELSALFQFAVAILSLIAIFSQIIQGQSFYHDDSTYILPNYITSFLHKTFIQLGIPQLMVYIRPQEYYDDLSKRLNESDLANTPQGADICLASTIGMEADDDSALISGLVNTGNTCFLNSVLQAMSSLPHLHVYLKRVSEVSTGVPLPVTRSLLKTIRTLTVPLCRRSSFRPVDIVTALSSNRRIISREQQDAEEFFQLVSGAMDTEGETVTKTELLGGGLKNLLGQPSLKGIVRPESINAGTHRGKMIRFSNHLENPFTGLLANRLSCIQCGYTGAIRHFSFNNIQLSVPNKPSTTLQECLAQFTAMEYLQDASCRRCSFISTLKSLSSEIETLKRQATLEKEKAKKPTVQLAALEKAKRKIERRFKAGRIEEEDEQDRLPLLKSVSRMSSKQVMLAKPPKILCLHISRSAFLNTGAVYKNTCQLLFPEYLDVSPFSTNGTLNTQPDLPISTPTTTAKGYYYRLMSVVVHYGSHSFGHFVAFKRRIFADQCQCFQCRTSQDKTTEDWKCQHAWYRISDSKVDECALDDVLRANPYMLLYELVDENDMEQDTASVTSTVSSSDQVEEENEQVETDYNNIPTDDAAKEALRIANSLLLDDSHTLLPS